MLNLGQMGNWCLPLISIKQRSADCRLWGQYGPLLMFVKDIFLEYSHFHVLCIADSTSHYNGRVEYLQQRRCSLQNLKYLLSLCLQPEFAAPWYKATLGCPLDWYSSRPSSDSSQHPNLVVKDGQQNNTPLLQIFPTSNWSFCRNSENPMWRLRKASRKYVIEVPIYHQGLHIHIKRN